ncbi:hypothetical protein HPB47_025070 [Ixodes persulcatus]|uniref:Uncharacterized protein n=1 Tax=Ixodes persulcatus TaxID=34615 RepID=A0AC60Q2J0_IXOPE|nr:hypothetical protein HPB47_025070 [Ixodes persulcatus]
MQAANHGHIVSIASLAGLGGVCRLTDYCGSKFAAVGFQEALSMELATDGYTGIRTTTVCPFFINTGMFAGADPGVFGFLEPEFVADEAVAAVLEDKDLLILPRIFYLLVALKAVCPSKVFITAANAFNVNGAMKSYYGRH